MSRPLATTETRGAVEALALALARALGEGWTVAPNTEYDHDRRRDVRHPDGRRYVVRETIESARHMIEAHGILPARFSRRTHEQKEKPIGGRVSFDRSPVVAALDIVRRVSRNYNEEWTRAQASIAEAQRIESEREKLLRDLTAGDGWQRGRSGVADFTAWGPGPLWKLVVAYDRNVELELRNLTPEQAAEVIRVLTKED